VLDDDDIHQQVTCKLRCGKSAATFAHAGVSGDASDSIYNCTLTRNKVRNINKSAGLVQWRTFENPHSRSKQERQQLLQIVYCCFYPHVRWHAYRQVWIYCLLFVCVYVCSVTNFSVEDKASGVKFCTAVRRRPRQGISHFGDLCFPQKPKSGLIGQRAHWTINRTGRSLA